MDGNPMSNTHYLKTWPEQFVAVRAQRKTFEFRQDDRDFQVGDRLILMEFFPVTGEYSGEQIAAEITYVLRGGLFGVPEGYAVLGLRLETRQPSSCICVRCDGTGMEARHSICRDCDDGVTPGAWRLVPVEPTETMVARGVSAFAAFGKASNGACNAYRRMIEAAPEQLDQGGSE